MARGMFTRIDHVELVTADLQRAAAFYTEVLGFKVFQRQKLGQGPLEEIAFMQRL